MLHDYVCRIAELQDQFVGTRYIEIYADIPLARILLRVVSGHAVCRWKREPGDVRARWFDLDDLGTQVLQRSRTQGAGQNAGKIHDAKSAERAAHGQRPWNLARPGPLFLNDASPIFKSSDC